MSENTILGTVPAASELHKVPGFDPMKHLRRAVNAQGEPVVGLEPRYQRLWFRMAYPKGRMLLNPLRVTDQLAIFEAKVFFHMEDPAPVSSFTSNKTARETPNYIRAAQDEALREALDNAGFGVQLCDVTHASGSEQSKAPAPSAQVSVNAPSAEVSPAPQPQKEPHAAPQPAPSIPPETPVQVEVASVSVTESEPANQPTAQAVEPAPEKTAPVLDVPDVSAQELQTETTSETQQSVLRVLDFASFSEEPVSPQGSTSAEEVEAPVTTDTNAPAHMESPAQAASSYTDDMTVEEIVQLMPMENAQALVVTQGPNKGLTMAQVAERRPSSLNFFLSQYCHCGNIQKAAATLLIQDLEQKKAG